ncbi:MAG: tRNA (5-methylaminomethyl-2-thiouridine)(34)-methyltransferase MnmD [Bacteroidales bacterium]|nr:tRNA (5-methylaminomethyl-2-thiouridine)(34)-methyltransferase MnmD [Bacteroidales bacterium]
MLKIISTSDGSSTIYVPELDEHYHSTFGAISESMHVFIDAGYRSGTMNPVSVFEMGFGTGLNALLTLYESIRDSRKVDYVSVEKYPLSESVYSKLNYHIFFPEEDQGYFNILHECRWDEPCRINDNFTLLKIRADFMEMQPDRVFDLVYYDAFAPGKQSGLWSFDIISKAASLLKPGGVFVTYSARGQLKRDLEKLGFTVEHRPGPAGKRHISRAVKKS